MQHALWGLFVLVACRDSPPPPPDAAPIAERTSLPPAPTRHEVLTWQGDPATTMTVTWQTTEPLAASEVWFDTTPHGGDLTAYPARVAGTVQQVPGLSAHTARDVHVVQLTDLKPATTYWFVAGDAARGTTAERAFRTGPGPTSPVRFVTGGDMGTGPAMRELLRHAAATSPQAAVIGGDVAYANGDLAAYAAWDRWLEAWGELMVTPDGLTVPLIVAIGNHEVAGGWSQPVTAAPFWRSYLPQGVLTYFARRLGEVQLLALDTGHVAPHAGAQATWLDATLDASDAAYDMAVYHVPLYPAHRPPDGEWSVAGREAWGPLFDAHHLDAAFENHDHVFKRTHPLVGGQPTAGGTVYFGDGCFGRDPRTVTQADNPVMAVTQERRHFWLVESGTHDDEGREGVTLSAVDDAGVRFDETFLPRR